MNLIIIFGIGRNNMISEKYFQKFITSYTKNDLKFVIHYYYLKLLKINNPRSGEFQDLPEISPNQFSSHKIFSYKMKELKIKDLFEKVKKKNDIHNDNFQTNKNLLCQLALLKKAGDNTDYNEYKSICFIRDDIFLTKDIDIKKLTMLTEEFSFLSAWSWNHGYNDRFFLTNCKGAEIYSSRINYVENFLNKFNFLNAEILLRYVLKKEKVKILTLWTKTIRIRSDSRIIEENNLLYNLLYTNNFLELLMTTIKSFLFLNKK